MKRIWPFQLAQAVEQQADGKLSVLLEDYQFLGEIKVRVLRSRSHPSAIMFDPIQPGTWGIVAFYRDDYRSGVWLGAQDDDLRNLLPTEAWQADPYVTLEHHPSDSVVLRHGDGSIENTYPDGSLIRVTTSKDDTLSNTTGRVALTARLATRKIGPGQSQRETYTPHSEPPIDIVLKHSSGALVVVTADGSFHLTTPKGHSLRLHDGTEKVRSSVDGSVTSTPEETAGRVSSEVILETELGHRITMHDDPVTNADRYLLIETPAGMKARLEDLPTKKLEFQTSPTRMIVVDETTGQTTVKDPTLVIVDAPSIQLGAGANVAVARQGDAVTITGTDSTGGAITATGVVQASATKTKAQ